jgi:hypothetical protein
MDRLRAPKTRQLLAPEVHEACALGEGVGNEVCGGAGAEDLSAGSQRADARGAVQRAAVVVTRTKLRLPGVEPHPSPERDAAWPLFGDELALECHGCGRRRGRLGEHRQGRVSLALGLHEDSAVGGDTLVDDLLMMGEGLGHR